MGLFALSPSSYLVLLLVCSICVLQALSTATVGRWGSDSGGYEWAYKAKGFISHISISHDIAIRSLRFTSQDDDGNIEYSYKFGVINGTNQDEVNIDIKLEKLNGISGTYSTVYSSESFKVTSLSFTTDTNKTFGPFGTVNGQNFSFPVKQGYVTGFSGSVNSMMDSLAIDTTSTVVGPWGGLGGSQWTYEPTDPLSSIIVTYDDDAIHTIAFTSQDSNGILHPSPKFGTIDGAQTAKILIDFTNGEKLIGISGTYDTSGSTMIITSLLFMTDTNNNNDASKVYGPFGWVKGTSFPLPIEVGSITGFHGRSSSGIDAIGVILASN